MYLLRLQPRQPLADGADPLASGFVVDDAIVMLENIVRHMEEGKSRLEAALNGAREIGFTILSMTLSLVAVFIPVLFMGGIVGRLLHEFAVIITVAILVSGFVSLTLTPMLCSRFLRPPGEDARPPLHGLGALLRRDAPGVRPLAQVDARPPAADDGGHAADLRAHRVALPADAQGIHPDRGHRSDLRVHRGRAGHLVRGDGGAAAGRRRDRPAGSQRRPASCRRSAPRRSTSARTPAASSCASSRGPSGRPPTRSSRICGRKLAAIPGVPGVPAEPADHPDRRQPHQGALPVHAPGDRSRRALSVGRRSSATRCARCRASRT